MTEEDYDMIFLSHFYYCTSNMVAMYHVYKLPLQTQFHCCNYDDTWNNLQKQQYAYSGSSLLCFLQVVLILSMLTCIVQNL